jgi:hypothetical protein
MHLDIMDGNLMIGAMIKLWKRMGSLSCLKCYELMLGCLGYCSFFNCLVLKVNHINGIIAKVWGMGSLVNIMGNKTIVIILCFVCVSVFCMSCKSSDVEYGVMIFTVLLVILSRRGKTI